MFLLTKLMIDKIKLCNYMSLFVSVVAVLGTKSKLEKLKYLMTVDLLTKTKSLLKTSLICNDCLVPQVHS